jgi:hypothetical protein
MSIIVMQQTWPLITDPEFISELNIKGKMKETIKGNKYIIIEDNEVL